MTVQYRDAEFTGTPVEHHPTPRGVAARGRLDQRKTRGKRSHLSGMAAETRVALDYERRGLQPVRQRWRGVSGEIDLIFRDGPELVFVEVKSAQSHDRAAEALRPAQMARLCAAAEEYIGKEPTGLLTPMRFDVALVNGQGETRILENAVGHF